MVSAAKDVEIRPIYSVIRQQFHYEMVQIYRETERDQNSAQHPAPPFISGEVCCGCMSHCLVSIKAKVSSDFFVLMQWNYQISRGLPYTLPALSNDQEILHLMISPVLLVLLLSFFFHQSSYLRSLCRSRIVVFSLFLLHYHSLCPLVAFSPLLSSLLLLPLRSLVVVCSTRQTSAGR